MNALIPERHSAAVPDRYDARTPLLQSPRGADDWRAMEKKRYAGRPLQAARPNGDPPALMLWGEDD